MESTKIFYDCGAAGFLSSATFDNVLIGMKKSAGAVLYYDKVKAKMVELEHRWFKEDDKVLTALREHLGESGVSCQDAVFSPKLLVRLMDIVPLPRSSGSFDLNLMNGCRICVSAKVVDALQPLLFPAAASKPEDAPDSRSHAWFVYYTMPPHPREKNKSIMVTRIHPTWIHASWRGCDDAKSFALCELGVQPHYSYAIGQQHFYVAQEMFQHVVRVFLHEDGHTIEFQMRAHQCVRVRLDDGARHTEFFAMIVPHLQEFVPINPVGNPHLVNPNELHAAFFNLARGTLSYVVADQLVVSKCTEQQSSGALAHLKHMVSTLSFGSDTLVIRDWKKVTVVPDGIQIGKVVLNMQPVAELFNKHFFIHRVAQ
jgi:hypothetical protein